MNETKMEIFHNTAEDSAGRKLGFLGYEPGHPVVAVFTFTVCSDDMPDPYDLAEVAFRIGNGDHKLSDDYYDRARRSMSVGDLARIDDLVWLVCQSAGFTLLSHWPCYISGHSSDHDSTGGPDVLADDLVPASADRQVATAWPQVDRYRASLDRLRLALIRQDVDDITLLLPEMPTLRNDAEQKSEIAVRHAELMFQTSLIARRAQAIRAQRTRTVADRSR